jgi:hypothetical protein
MMRELILMMGVVVAGMPLHAEELHYSHPLPDGSIDRLTISAGQTVLITTRQVGSGEGFRSGGIVPYPTVCRIKYKGWITKNNNQSVFKVESVEEIYDPSLVNEEDCPIYVQVLNQEAPQGISFALKLSGFTSDTKDRTSL